MGLRSGLCADQFFYTAGKNIYGLGFVHRGHKVGRAQILLNTVALNHQTWAYNLQSNNSLVCIVLHSICFISFVIFA